MFDNNIIKIINIIWLINLFIINLIFFKKIIYSDMSLMNFLYFPNCELKTIWCTGRQLLGPGISIQAGPLCFSGAYLICSESLLHQDIFYPLNMIALQLYEVIFHGSPAGQLGLEMGTELLKIYLVGIYSLNDCNFFSIPALLDFYRNPLLLLGNLFTDAKLPGKAADGAHLRTHFVAVTSARRTFIKLICY